MLFIQHTNMEEEALDAERDYTIHQSCVENVEEDELEGSVGLWLLDQQICWQILSQSMVPGQRQHPKVEFVFVV